MCTARLNRSRRILSLGLAFALLATLFFALSPMPADAAAYYYPPEGHYFLKPLASASYAMDVCGGGDAPVGTKVHLWEQNFTDAQDWFLKCVDSNQGWYLIVHARTGLVLNVVNGEGRNDARLWLYYNDSTPACHFRFIRSGGGYLIQSRLGNFVIDLDNASTFNGSVLHLWSYHSGLSAQWELTPVQRPSNYYVKTNGARLNVRSSPSGDVIGKLNNGTAVSVWSISGSWAKIAYHNGIGYVSSDYLTMQAPAAISQLQQTVANTAISMVGKTGYSGYCQRFVRVVLERCGVYARTDASSALDACNKWRVSTSMDDIPVGAAVYLRRKTSGSAGYDYGHVGIYIGNGFVVHAQDTVKKTSLSELTKTYNYLGWGWQAGRDLR